MSIPPPEGAPPRRRTVAVPLARRPFALVGPIDDAVRTLIVDRGPQVAFPTLSHFLGANREPWAGILIARAGSWDPRLMQLVPDRERIALTGAALQREWPTDITRLRDEGEIRSWLDRCLSPIVRAPSAGARAPSKRNEPLAPSEARVYARPHSQLLLVAAEPNLRTRLFHELRGPRPVRVVADLSELEPAELVPEAWLGVVVAARTVDEARLDHITRSPAVLLRLDPDAAPPDVAELRAWVCCAVAYEYCGHSEVAREIGRAFASAAEATYTPSLETAALYASTLPSQERSTALDLREQTWRWYAKHAGRTLGRNMRELAEQALGAANLPGPVPPSRWLSREIQPEPVPWTALARRIPRDLLDVPLSSVPWPERKLGEMLGIAEQHGARTVAELLSLDAAVVETSWAGLRACDSLFEALLSANPRDANGAVEPPGSFAAFVAWLGARLPGGNEANPLLTTTELNLGTRRALRFHEPVLTKVKERIERAVAHAADLEELRRYDPFFADLPSLENLANFGRSVLRLRLLFPRRAVEARGSGREQDHGMDEKPARASVAARRESNLRRAESASGALKQAAVQGIRLAEQLLSEHGKPMLRVELAQALGPTAPEVLHRMAGTRPFVETDSRSWGLVDRDVPGGRDAFEAALTLLGTSVAPNAPITDDVIASVRALSPTHLGWTREIVVSAIRSARST